MDNSNKRLFIGIMLIRSLSKGITVTITAIYFTQMKGLSLGEYGACLSISAIVSMVFSPFIGHLSDKYGAKKIFIVLMLLQGTFSFLYILAWDSSAILLLLLLVTNIDRGAAAARGALIGQIIEKENRVKFTGLIRSVVNGMMAVGAGAGSFILVMNTLDYYQTAILFDVGMFLIAGIAALFFKEAHRETTNQELPISSSASTSFTYVLKDRLFMFTMLLNSLLSFHTTMITVALPIWLSIYTGYPVYLISIAMVINTVGILLFQVRAGKNVDSFQKSAKKAQYSGLFLMLACLLIGISAVVNTTFGIIVLIISIVLHLCGELFQAVSGWFYSFELSPADSYGKYQAIFNSSYDISSLLSPLIYTALVIPNGLSGWIVLGLFFLIVSQLERLVPLFIKNRNQLYPIKEE